ncbi:S8 family serine peptidase [Tahibacter soli]|uniref:S8 family serine peptidase n=1 Tax=Tahibacter soli TaxID=2983605 RepID=A0A9X3YM50_9GAMM|nr:S8 family serine peptidase [Tahibacter soli]MDC8014931.1 S8 family serine peptidase [Tahibacter soli]
MSFSAQAADERCTVSFDAAQMDVCTGKVSVAHPALEPLANLKGLADSPLRLIKFAGPITDADRAIVEASGAQILGYAPDYAYIVRLDPRSAKPVRWSPRVVWTGPFLPAFKVDINIANELTHGTLVREGGIEELAISLHPSASRAALEQRVNAAPGLSAVRTVTAGGDTRLLARFDAKQLATSVAALAADPDVAAIGFQWKARLLNSQAGWLHQSNVSSPSPLRPLFDRGLYGCGQTVGVLDSGLHIAHCSFNDATQPPPVSACKSGASCPPVAAPNNSARKVTAYYKWSDLAGTAPADNHGHGTHVAGSIAGQNPANAVDCANFTTPGGNTDLDGTAPGAKIVMQESGANLAYLNSHGGNPYHAADMAYTNGARLHSNSWGEGCVNSWGMCVSSCSVTYDAQARAADSVARDRDDLVVLYAAGNDATACSNGNNVGSPGNAKNVITVGATLRGASANGMASFSSRGPTNDSRTKPDVTAQGDNIVSADRNACGTLSMSGTSMATPTAAGLAALVRDYLARGFYPTGQKVAANAIANPSGALIKAILISGASTMTGTGASTSPGQSQGWGRIHLDNSLYFNGDASRLYIHDAPTGLATGGVDTHTITVVAGQPLNIALTWTDVAAAIGANPALVNALRLEVVAPNGDVWTQKLPSGVNVNNANPTQSITTTNYDNRNNVHRISFANPTAGTYTARVVGINVPTGPQKYGLAATGNFTVGGANGFTLAASPSTVNVCAGSNASFTIGAERSGTFASPVALSVAGVPGSATRTFSPASVVPASPAANSTLTIGNTAGVASGSYSLVVTGTSTSPAMTRTAGATLNVTSGVTAAGSLSAPANGATGQSTTPALSWAAISGASSYRVQIATDAAFTNLVVNQTVTGTSFTPSTALANNTPYFWRVNGINGCGEGAKSDAFGFTTVPVAANFCRTPNLAIPDNNTTGATDSQTVGAAGTLSNLRLSFNVTHTYMGDLTLILTKGTTSVTLLQRPGNASNSGTSGCGGDNANVIADNAATQTLESNCTNATPAYTTGASYKPNNPFTPFVGQSLAGTWSLRAIDSAGSDVGTLVQWCLLPTL